MDRPVAPASVRRIGITGHPLDDMLLPVPVVCFVGVLLTDISYLQSGGNLVWLDFSSWLLLVGLIFGVIAAVVLAIDIIRSPGVRTGSGWAHLSFFYSALLVELLSMFVHQRDGWTAVAGLGLILSILGAGLTLVAAWLRRPAMEVVR